MISDDTYAAEVLRAHPISKPLSRLWKRGVLTGADVVAAVEIESAVLSIFVNDIHSSADEQRVWKTPALLKSHDIRQAYYSWLGAMYAADLSAGPVLDVVIDGKALHRVDLSRCRRKGWTRRLLKKALPLYSRVRAAQVTDKIRLTA